MYYYDYYYNRYYFDITKFQNEMMASGVWMAIIMAIIVLHVVCMVLCPLIARQKGRNTVGWFLGGLFLGGIGLIIISCLSKKRHFRLGKLKIIYKS